MSIWKGFDYTQDDKYTHLYIKQPIITAASCMITQTVVSTQLINKIMSSSVYMVYNQWFDRAIYIYRKWFFKIWKITFNVILFTQSSTYIVSDDEADEGDSDFVRKTA